MVLIRCRIHLKAVLACVEGERKEKKEWVGNSLKTIVLTAAQDIGLFSFVGADKDSVRTSYKRLALKWHPDKHDGANHATKVS